MTFINLAEHLFGTKKVPADCDIVFVADMFLSDYAGGAELTTEALIESSPLNVFKVHSKFITMELLQSGHEKYWIFGNFSELDQNLIPTIVANLQYSIIEYDYKYCKYRSPEKHLDIEKQQCNCQNEQSGKMVSAFMYGAKSLWWMSEKQQSSYEKLFPFLREKESTVLSSVFNDSTFVVIKQLREANESKDRKGWIVVGSPSWIKGTKDAEAWCEANGHEYETIWGLTYLQTLEKLSQAEGLAFLPKGGDTCPRIVIEAKLLGCKLHLNDNVQHKDEIWFNTDDMFDTEAYLYMSRDRFWSGIKATMAYNPPISGYTTTKDCIEQDYPFVESIMSMLGFCDQVVVVDGGSTDGTWEKLQELAAADQRILIHQQKRDWSHPRFAVFDGAQKALARSLCTGQYCWQQDSDEIVHENDYDKIRRLVKTMPKNIPILSLPVIEYWGCIDKVRLDINVSKWRLSQNNPMITHGIPSQLRVFDSSGELYSKPGSDGCDYVKSDDYEALPHASFMTPDVDKVRVASFNNQEAKNGFEKWFNTAIKNLPSVHHFSWFNIKRKIKTYQNYWSKHWQSLYDISHVDNAENNMFFDKPWADVNDNEIESLANRLATEMGGWIFHRKIDFSVKTPYMSCQCSPPAIMKEWITRNS